MSARENQELLRRALAGDQDALGELLEAQNQLLKGMAVSHERGR